MIDLAVLLVPDRHHGHLDRDDAALAVIPQHFLADVICCDQLAHQPIVVNMNIIDETIDHIRIAEMGAYQRAERRDGELRDAASSNKTRRPCPKEPSDFNLMIHRTYLRISK